MIPRPKSGTDYLEYFDTYVSLVTDPDVLQGLTKQGANMAALIRHNGESKGGYAYADGKWSIKRLLLHLTDGERMFCYRALCIARGDQQALPGFDQDAYAANDGSEARTLMGILDEYLSVRKATVSLFQNFTSDALARRGVANGSNITASALPWIMLGHDIHHYRMMIDRYGMSACD